MTLIVLLMNRLTFHSRKYLSPPDRFVRTILTQGNFGSLIP